MGLLHRAETGSNVAPSVSSLVDNYGLVEAQGTAGQNHLSSILSHGFLH